MNLVNSIAKLFSARVGKALITFGGITYFARELDPHALGVFFLFQALLGLLSMAGDFGLRGAIEKRISEGTDPGRYLATGIALKLVPIGLVILLVLAFSDTINDYVGAEVAVLLSAALVLQEFANVTVKVLNAELNVGKTAVLRLSRQVVWVAVGALLLSLGYGVSSLFYGLLSGFFVMFVWGVSRASTPLGKPSLEHARSLFSYSKYNFISFSLAGYFYGWVDVAILGLFLTQSQVGAYEIAWRVSLITTLLSSAVGTTIFPQMSQWAENEEYGKIEQLLTQSITPSVVLVIPATFGVWLVGREVLQFVFGPAYATAWLVLVILMVEKVFRSVHVVIGHALQAIDKPALAARAALVAIVLNVAFNFLLVPLYGIVGAAIATAGAFIVNTLLHARYLSRFLDIRLPVHDLKWCLLASTVMTLFSLGIQRVVRPTSLATLLFVIGLSASLYVVILLASPKIRFRIHQQVRSIGA